MLSDSASPPTQSTKWGVPLQRPTFPLPVALQPVWKIKFSVKINLPSRLFPMFQDSPNTSFRHAATAHVIEDIRETITGCYLGWRAMDSLFS